MANKRPGSRWTANPRVSCDAQRHLNELRETALSASLYAVDGPSWPVSSRIRRDARNFAVNYLFDEVLSKYDDGKSSDRKRETALEKFAAAELTCNLANERLRSLSYEGSVDPRSVRSLLEAAARKVNSILGPFSWDEVSEGFGFGPGATTRLRRDKADAAYKYSGTPETTLQNLALALAAIRSNDIWMESCEGVRVVRGSKITTVPKNEKTDRVIGIEPDMNIYIQKGIGSVIRNRLRRWGVNLNNQEINQDLARLASIRGFLATIDLSAASDSVCYELVKLLLPPDWFMALEQCRSREGLLPSGDYVTFQKFSAMGNGYTFELESLLFYALAQAVCDAYLPGAVGYTSVYGDDIIVASDVAGPLIDLLTFCGFSTNKKKTFIDGPFRESCGKHYYLGIDVSPFYVRRPVDKLSELFLFHNNIYRWAKHTIGLEAVDFLLRSIRACAPQPWRKPRIPDGVGDGAFVGTFTQCTPQASKPMLYDQWEGFSVEILMEKSRSRKGPPLGRLISSLLKVGLEEPWDSLSNTGQSYWTVGRTVILDWSD